MTATEELCRMLDERGVEYVLDEEYGKKYPPEQRITWSCDLAGKDMTVTARDYCIGINEDGSGEYCLDLEFHEVFTPEQAVEATLGRGTCHAIDTGYATAFCSVCGAEFMGSIMTNEPPDYVKPLTRCPECGRKIVEVDA